MPRAFWGLRGKFGSLYGRLSRFHSPTYTLGTPYFASACVPLPTIGLQLRHPHIHLSASGALSIRFMNVLVKFTVRGIQPCRGFIVTDRIGNRIEYFKAHTRFQKISRLR